MKSSRYLVLLAAFSLLSGGSAFADGAAASSGAQDKAPGQTACQALQAEIALQPA
jgi:hypothetical protein